MRHVWISGYLGSGKKMCPDFDDVCVCGWMDGWVDKRGYGEGGEGGREGGGIKVIQKMVYNIEILIFWMRQ